MVDPDVVEVGEFLEAPPEATVPRGVYRVVGLPGGALVCLRVTDEGGNRANTGEVVRVDAADVAALRRTSEPRTGAAALLRNQLEGPYWLVRSLLPF